MAKSVKNNRLQWLLWGLTVIGCLYYLIYWYTSTHPLSSPKYGFQYYHPTQLPSKFSITQKRIDVSNKKSSPVVEMNLRYSDWVYEIQESNAAYSSPTEEATNLSNYDPNSTKVTCKQEATLMDQSYRLCHWIDYGKISVYQVVFIKSETFADKGTYIKAEFPGNINQTIPTSEFNEFVDSFIKAKATGCTLISSNV